MRRILLDRSFKIAIVLTLLFLGIGFALLHYGLVKYGWTFFILLPVVLGTSIGALPSKKAAYLGLGAGLISFLTGLLMIGAEGYICILMTLPFIFPLLFLGSVITHLLKRYHQLKATDKLNILLLPFLPFLFGGLIEKMIAGSSKEVISIRSEIILPYTNVQVYDAIKSVDTLIAEKPWLMKLDLPVPQKCILEKEAVGGLRTCYFEGGKILERITALEKGKILRMNVIKYELTGRKWLGFQEAIYTFDSIGSNSCKMTRITTYTSELKPRFYWASLERLGIEQEHQYVFSNLKNDLTISYGK
jgi:hypothetical protein